VTRNPFLLLRLYPLAQAHHFWICCKHGVHLPVDTQKSNMHPQVWILWEMWLREMTRNPLLLSRLGPLAQAHHFWICCRPGAHLPVDTQKSNMHPQVWILWKILVTVYSLLERIRYAKPSFALTTWSLGPGPPFLDML